MEKSENAALPFLCGPESLYFPKRWRHRLTSPPLASELWTLQRFITTTTTTTTCLCSCRRRYWAFLATYSPCSWVWVTAAATSLTVHIKDSGFLALAIFIFFLLCSVSPSTVCFYTERKLSAHALSLLHFWWTFSSTYRPGIWTKAFSALFSGPCERKYSWTMPRKTEEKKHCSGTYGKALCHIR